MREQLRFSEEEVRIVKNVKIKCKTMNILG